MQDTSNAMHLLRSARKAPPALPMPVAALTEEAETQSVEEPLKPLQLSALETVAAELGLPAEACTAEHKAPSPVAERPPMDGKDADSCPEATHLEVRAGDTMDSPLPVVEVGVTVLLVSLCLFRGPALQSCRAMGGWFD